MYSRISSIIERKIVADRWCARNQQHFMNWNCFLWTRTKYAGHWSKYLISYEFIKYLFEEAVTMEQCAYLTISTWNFYGMTLQKSNTCPMIRPIKYIICENKYSRLTFVINVTHNSHPYISVHMCIRKYEKIYNFII